MANTTRLIVDTAYTTLSFTAADLNSLATGGAALSTGVIANSTGLDEFIEFSFVVTVGGTTLANSPVTLFLLPLNQDGTTYGDGFASSTTVQPVQTYYRGQCLPKVGVTTGSTITGTFPPSQLTPDDYKVAFGNNLGVALSATAALTLKYKTWNRNLNA